MLTILNMLSVDHAFVKDYTCVILKGIFAVKEGSPNI